MDSPPYSTMPDISFSVDGISKLLSELDPSKSPGPDGISPIILKCCAAEIAPVLQITGADLGFAGGRG